MSLIDKIDELNIVVGENELKRIIEFAKKHELRNDSTFAYGRDSYWFLTKKI